MGDHNPKRIIVMMSSLFVYLAALVFSMLAGSGPINGFFLQGMRRVSEKYDTDMTPAAWTFYIWGLIYSWLSCTMVYLLAGLCRRNAYGWMYSHPALLPYGFYLCWTINYIFNIAWLFLFDRENLVAGVIFSALVASTNYLEMMFSSHGLKVYGAWLYKHHRLDLWLIWVLVQNGVALYATWTTLTMLLNLTVVLVHRVGVSPSDAATLSLALLLLSALAWFVLENFIFEIHVRYIVSIYPIVIFMLSGIIARKVNVLAVVDLVLMCILLLVRIVLVVWRHGKHPLYQDADSSAVTSPMDIAAAQKVIFT
ncbi:hypothetical protein GN956_G14172 [Arapaima gigas]